jgi:AcrR family transcriptional regulator
MLHCNVALSATIMLQNWLREDLMTGRIRDNARPKREGRRALKRQQTLQRIAKTGLKLFVAKGYEATTLEDIAAASGISRRTFFNYMKSKEEVLLAWQRTAGFSEAIRPAIAEEAPNQGPLDAACNCFLKLVSRHETKESIAVDRLMRSTDALRARRQAVYVDLEDVVFSALCELWPEPKRKLPLRIVAMMSVGALRLAMNNRWQDDAKRPLAEHLREQFAALKAAI